MTSENRTWKNSPVDPLVVFPDPPATLARALAEAGLDFLAVDSSAAERHQRPTGEIWQAALVLIESGIGDVGEFVATLRAESPATPILVLCPAGFLTQLADAELDFDDFCVLPVQPRELGLRVARLPRDDRAGSGADPGLITYGPLQIDTSTYQAMIDGTPLDLTYMEYELLKYFAQRPGRVCTRQVLLGQVWGYEYYGGARTVDVHVRRLRAKLGEQHAGLIGTVRSVGYRFGTSQWNRQG